MPRRTSSAKIKTPVQTAAVWNEVLTILGDKFVADAQAERLNQFRGMVIGASINGKEARGPVREVLGLLGDRWSTFLLQLLHYGPFRFSTLQRLVGTIIDASISRRMLAHKLRALERNGLVSRTVTPTSPPQVEYALTAIGEELWVLAADMVEWLSVHVTEIEAARTAFALQEEKTP